MGEAEKKDCPALPDGLLRDMREGDRERHPTLLQIAAEVLPHAGETVIVHDHDLVRLLGVATDMTDIYYIVEKGGRTWWASAVGRITPLRGRITDEEYSAFSIGSDPATVEMQIVIEDGLHRRWIAGKNHEPEEPDPVFSAGQRCLESIREVERFRLRHARDRVFAPLPALMGQVDERLERLSSFPAFHEAREPGNRSLATILDLLDAEAGHVRNREIAAFEFARRGALMTASGIGAGDETIRAIAGAEPPPLLADIPSMSWLAHDLSLRLWPGHEPPEKTDLDEEVEAHLHRTCRWTGWFLLAWLQENAWIVDRIAEHRENGRLSAPWVPFAYFCASLRPHALRHGYPGSENELRIVFSDLGYSLD